MANSGQTQEDSENFWRVEAGDHEFWENYVSTRPNYGSSFYKEIYDHHAAHSSSWSVAHDVGCGAGQVSAELASRFKHVVASDNNAEHVAVARQRLKDFSEERISYVHSKGEDLAQHQQAGSVDVIACAEAMVLMDEHAALRSFAGLLRPGGTLAAWFYGRPTFSEPEYHDACQHLLGAIMVKHFRKVMLGVQGKRKDGVQRAGDGMASWLDYLDLDPAVWEDARRIKWNPNATLPFYGREACDFDMNCVSNVRDGERTESRNDPEWWRSDWDEKELKRYIRVLFPKFQEVIGDGDPEIDTLFDEMTERIGGSAAVRSFTWPAVLVMATKKA